MSFLLLQEACKKKKNLKDVKFIKWDELPVGDYKVDLFKLTESNYGLKIQVIFLLDGEKRYVSLPDRFSEKLNQDSQIDELNQHQYTMKFFGKDTSWYKFITLDFVQMGKLVYFFSFVFLN